MMSETIKNRYEFVILFDVETGIQMGTLTRATCQGWIPKVDTAW